MKATGKIRLFDIGPGEQRLSIWLDNYASADEAILRVMGRDPKEGDRFELTVRKIVPTPTELPKRLTDDDKTLLWVFAGSYNCWSEEGYALGFSAMPWERTKSRRVARRLKRLGLLSFHRGLFNDDGQVAGSGYSLTDLGREALSYLTLLSPEVRLD